MAHWQAYAFSADGRVFATNSQIYEEARQIARRRSFTVHGSKVALSRPWRRKPVVGEARRRGESDCLQGFVGALKPTDCLNQVFE